MCVDDRARMKGNRENNRKQSALYDREAENKLYHYSQKFQLRLYR